MSKKAVVFLASGFEEIEAVTILDTLRRAEILTVAVSVVKDGSKMVLGAHNIGIEADASIEEMELQGVDLAVCPGGMPGAVNLADHEGVRDYLCGVHAAGGIAAAICAAPIVLDAAGLLKGRHYTCYPGCQQKISSGIWTGRNVEEDDRVITGSGPGTALEFALHLVERIRGPETAEALRRGMLLQNA